MSRAPTSLDLYLLNQVRQVLTRSDPAELKDVLSSLETGIALILATRSADEIEIALGVIASIVDEIKDGKFPLLPVRVPLRPDRAAPGEPEPRAIEAEAEEALARGFGLLIKRFGAPAARRCALRILDRLERETQGSATQ